MSSTNTRKSSAVMFANIVGHLSMMAKDETRTLELLKDFYIKFNRK